MRINKLKHERFPKSSHKITIKTNITRINLIELGYHLSANRFATDVILQNIDETAPLKEPIT